MDKILIIESGNIYTRSEITQVIRSEMINILFNLIKTERRD